MLAIPSMVTSQQLHQQERKKQPLHNPHYNHHNDPHLQINETTNIYNKQRILLHHQQPVHKEDFGDMLKRTKTTVTATVSGADTRTTIAPKPVRLRSNLNEKRGLMMRTHRHHLPLNLHRRHHSLNQCKEKISNYSRDHGDSPDDDSSEEEINSNERSKNCSYTTPWPLGCGCGTISIGFAICSLLNQNIIDRPVLFIPVHVQ